jgi:hypothetical protein
VNRKQHKTLDFIRRFYFENGHFPTIREIAVGTGHSIRSVQVASDRVNALIRLGHLVRHGRYLEWPSSEKEDQHKTYIHAVRLLKAISPGTKPLPTTIGILDQIDNWTTQFTRNAA